VSTTLAPLRISGFRRLFTAYSVNGLGNWFGEIALSLVVYEATHSVLAVSALWVIGRFLPALAGPALISRLQNRAAGVPLAPLYLLEGALFAALTAAVLAGLPVGVLLAIALLDGVLALAVRALTRTAVVGQTRPAGLLGEGNALLSVSQSVSMAAGPAVAGIAVATLGAGSALALDAVSFAVAALVVRGTRAGAVEPAERTVLRDALTRLRGQRETMRLLRLDGVTTTFFTLIIPVELVFVTQTIGGTAGDFGLVLAAWGGGATLGSAMLPVAMRLAAGKVLLVGFAVVIGGYAGMGSATTVGTVVAFSLLGGIGNGVSTCLLTTALQQRTPDGLQAQLNGLMEAVHSAAPGVGFLAGGILATVASPRAVYFVAAAGALLVVASGVRVLLATRLDVEPAFTHAIAPAPA
jgi:hypothetical protein